MAFLLIFSLLLGCSPQPQGDENVLWVLTEQSKTDGMNLQAQMAAQTFQQDHPQMQVRLEILPPQGENRRDRLKQLRSQIMAGGGPDVYLLPAGEALLLNCDESWRLESGPHYPEIEPLFPDVSQAIQNRLFYDIADFYQADTDLGQEALQPDIMAAGCRGDQRFVLPLRFDMPVLLTDPACWEQWGISAAFFQQSALELAESAVKMENPRMAMGLSAPTDFQWLGRPIDYAAGTLLISPEEIGRYLSLYQQWRQRTVQPMEELLEQAYQQTIETEIQYYQSRNPEKTREEVIQENPQWEMVFRRNLADFNELQSYIYSNWLWNLAGFPIFQSILTESMHSARIFQGMGWTLEMYPLRTVRGETTATITYWGAVGGGSKCPELAYEYLRSFLTEYYQWDIYRPRVKKEGPFWEWPPEPQTQGMVENSWPVRVKGSVPLLWDNMLYQYQGAGGTDGGAPGRMKAVKRPGLPMTDAQVPVLAMPIDQVVFPIHLPQEKSLAHVLEQLNHPDGTPTDADIDALAQEVWQNLWWHMAEG